MSPPEVVSKLFEIAFESNKRRITERVYCMPWSDKFEDPIPGIGTLLEAADYIQKLPKAQQQLPHWQTAVEV